MRDVLLIVAGGSVAAALALACGWLLWAPPAERLPPDVAAPRGVEPPAAGDPAVAAQLARIESQLDRLTAVVGALDHRLDDLRASTPARTPATTAPPIDGEALANAMQQAIERQERARLDALTDGEMRAAARELLYSKKDAAGARRMLEALLERPLSRDDRAAALTELGIVHRDANDLAASERTLQQAIDLLGIDSEGGAWAAFQLAWTYQGLRDDARARAVFDSVDRSAQAEASLRLEARWNAAKLALAAGDTARARSAFESLLRECGDRDEFRHIVDDVRERLRSM